VAAAKLKPEARWRAHCSFAGTECFSMALFDGLFQ